MERRPTLKDFSISCILVLLSSAISLMVAEGIAQLYAAHIAKRGKLFKPSATVGWQVLPDLDLVRLNANGELWQVKTDRQGHRAASSWDKNADTKLLILGDSYVFGEGVSIEDRFDTLIQQNRLDWSTINTGVMGYGTDQQIIASRRYFRMLGNKDIVILLTCYNDFYDITRKRHSGRSKPWFEVTRENRLLEHKPTISWREILRDRSYILSRTMNLFEKQKDFSTEEIDRAGTLYYSIIHQETGDLIQKGVNVIIAYHGLHHVKSKRARASIVASLNRTCSIPGIDCLSLDRALTQANNGMNFLNDLHWNRSGHKVVATVLENYLASKFD